MKLKDIKGDLVGYCLKIPNYKEKNLPKKNMYIKSGWNKGLWLSIDKDKDGLIYPLFFEKPEEVLDLDVEEKTNE